MALNALAIDIMLPALPVMGEALGVVRENDRQLVVVGFIMGVGFGQLMFGPLSDRFGRRRILLLSLIFYAGLGGACAIPGSFSQLVIYRTIQGGFAAGVRVVSLSLVRDLFEGARMARIMSWVTMVFMAVPIIAPNLGYLILQFFDWRAIFWTLVISGLLFAAWVFFRLPETLPKDRRRSIQPRVLFEGYREVWGHPVSRAYTLATGLMFAALFSFISASEQLFRAFEKGESFPIYFAGVAGTMALASFTNARFVERVGPRALSFGALVVFTSVQVGYFGLYLIGFRGFEIFYGTTLASFFAFSMIGANFNAIALAPLGHIAGTASAVLGFTSTTIAGSIGGLIGRQFDGTPLPTTLGYMGLGILSLGMVTVGCRIGKTPHQPPEEGRASSVN